MMNWLNCYSSKRSGYNSSNKEVVRSDFQRDFDRLIFSSAFRRLQNKTQVFPLPGSSTFVHNRLTHSLEVASVGRSLGTIIGESIAEKLTDEDAKHFYTHDLKAVISAGCLAHDVGNPAYGHSGEKAISNYFVKNEKTLIGDQALKSYFSEKEWLDLIDFEGNANALRVLTHQFKGKSAGGLNLTYATLCSILKYPCESITKNRKHKHLKKYGFFQSEKEIFEDITKESRMYLESEEPLSYKRHPFVYIVEAADDICYRIIDIEDAHRIGILKRYEVEQLLLSLLENLNGGKTTSERTLEVLELLEDNNEAIAFLRAKSIGALVNKCAEVFQANESKILAGTYKSTLMDDVQASCPTLADIEKLSIDTIYNHPSVIKVELAGYKVMSGLLEIFIPAILSPHPDHIEEKTLVLIPRQFEVEKSASAYDKVMSIIDYVSGMTDDYAIDMYRKFVGIEIADHSN